MGWQAALDLHYRRDGGRTVAAHRHEGPLRVLKALYPEGPLTCHHVVVHPPAGIAAGDRLGLSARLDAGTRVLLTTPGATRFYRCDAGQGEQQVDIDVAAGACLEWTPGETLVYDGAQAVNQLQFRLAPGARMIGWEVTALGLPAAALPFRRGALQQRLSVAALGGATPVTWLEQGRLAADDTRLLESSLGLGGRRALATMWFGIGDTHPDDGLDAAMGAARQVAADLIAGWQAALPDVPGDAAGGAAGLPPLAGVTRAMPHVLVLRGLADRVEPLVQLLRAVRRAWREPLLGAPPVDPRVWST